MVNESLENRALSRRGFLGLVGALAVTSVLPLGGCGGQRPEDFYGVYRVEKIRRIVSHNEEGEYVYKTYEGDDVKKDLVAIAPEFIEILHEGRIIFREDGSKVFMREGEGWKYLTKDSRTKGEFLERPITWGFNEFRGRNVFEGWKKGRPKYEMKRKLFRMRHMGGGVEMYEVTIGDREGVEDIIVQTLHLKIIDKDYPELSPDYWEFKDK
ncbi:MAG: hypothetical protein NUV97_01805 [archaeon]|nr:hypothetical protein [archaeon]MCR4323688.1 hypothetical protein [Nanoarchaeota archaeon]